MGLLGGIGRGDRGLSIGTNGASNGGVIRRESKREGSWSLRRNVRGRDSRPWLKMTGDVIIVFLFLIFFVTFEIMLQIKSNKFVKICKIPSIETRHLGTTFGTKRITKIPFW